MDERLLAPCTADLLRGWTGPVHGYVHRGVPTRAVSIGEFEPCYGGAMLWTEMGDALALPKDLSLDLSLAECEWRVSASVGVPSGARLHWRRPKGARSDLGRWRAFGDAVSQYTDEPSKDRRFPSRMVVPALADLNPEDNASLPDGRRMVDLLALAAVWREVSRGK